MASVISVLAKLRADTGSYVSGMKVAQKATENFQKTAVDGSRKTQMATADSFGKMGQGALRMGAIVKTAVMGFLTIQGAQFLKGAIASASTFQAEFEGVNQTFGKSAGIVQDFAKQAAQSAGLAENSALRFAKSFGGYGKSAGLAGDAQAKFATQMVQAAGDLGSFFDLPTESALMAIQQGLRGEYEPLRRFNILLDEATIGQIAMGMGISKTGKNLTQQQKVLARQQGIMQQMGVAQGDFVKYGSDYGNQIKTTSALFQNLTKDVGGALLPAMSKLAAAVVPLLGVLGPMLTDVVASLVPIIDAVATAMGGLEPVMKPVLDVFKIVATTVANFAQQVLPPLLGILAPVLETFKLLVQPLSTLVNSLIGPLAQVLDSVATGLQSLMPSMNMFSVQLDVIVKAMQPLFDALGAVASDLVAKLMPVVMILAQALTGAIAQLIPAFLELMPTITSLIMTIANIIPALLPFITMAAELAAQILPMLMNAFVQLMPALIPLIQAIVMIVMALMPLLPPIFTLIQTLLPPLISLFQALLPVIVFLVQILSQGLTAAFQLVGSIIQTLVPIISGILNFFTDMVNGIIDGINWVLTSLGQAPIPKLEKNAMNDAFQQGKDLKNAQIAGMDSLALPPLTPTTGTTKPLTPTGGGGGGAKKKNSVVEFYKKMNADIKQQKAKTKLLAMGLNDELAQSVVSSGEGWEKIYKKIAKGGTKAIENLESKWVQTAAGMAKIADTVKDTMSSIQDSIMNGFDVSKMGTTTKQIMGNARKMVAKAKQFGEEIVKLSKSGLNPTLLNQVIAAGPEQGLALARSLQSADIGELNGLYNQLGETAMATGGAVAQNQVQYTINVNGGIGDKNTIGKSIVEAIKSYERQSGTTWRTA